MKPMTLEQIARIAKRSIEQDNRNQGLQALPGARRGMHLYYRFLFEVCRELMPKKVVELGVCLGVSGFHLAAACKPHGGHVWGVDCHRQHINKRLFKVPNYTFLHLESVRAAKTLAKHAPFDLVFFDTVHNREQLEAEVEAYEPLMARPGLMLFDNLLMNDLPDFWRECRWQKKGRNDRLSDQSDRKVNQGGFGWIILDEEPEADRHLTASEAKPYLGLEPDREEGGES